MKSNRCLLPSLLLAISFPGAVRGQLVFELGPQDITSAPAAVSVAGTFNNWDTEATPMSFDGSVWRAALALADGRHYYKFVWRDAAGQTHWMLDPRNPCLADNGLHGANNVLDVKDAKAARPTDGMEHFCYLWFGAKWVAVAGDFNQWWLGQFPLYRAGTPGEWEVWIELKRPFSYRFIRDGQWLADYGPERWPRVPNGFGSFNSYRPADAMTLPDAVDLTDEVRAGDATMIERIKQYDKEADYGRAVRLAREVALANERALGTTHSLRLRALELEARIHQRWARFDEAVACWETLAAVANDTSETRNAIQELAAYYTHIRRDSEAARRLCERAIVRAEMTTDLVGIVIRHVEATYKERRYEEVVLECDMWLGALPPPDGRDKPYACQLSELWLYKALAHKRLGQLAGARNACERLIAIHPYPDSQNVQRAQDLLAALPQAAPSP